jgi:hypothetical protein
VKNGLDVIALAGFDLWDLSSGDGKQGMDVSMWGSFKRGANEDG